MDQLKAYIETHPALTFWWRDDDACAASPQLDMLIALGIPVKLAMIPDKVQASFDLPQNFAVWQHGFDHTNHSAGKKCELSDAVSQSELLANLKSGQAKLQHLFPYHFENILTPPWNRIDPNIGAQLTFYDAISSYYKNEIHSDLPRRDCHIDLVDWQTKQLKSYDVLLSELQKLEAQNITHIGILSHHLIHSKSDFEQLKTLAELLPIL